MSLPVNGLYEFGEFRFDPVKRTLWSGGEMVPLSPKAAEVLAVLLAGGGNLVERQELIDSVWADTFVEEGNLNQAISALRKALGSDVIQTVPRRGYRFAGEIHRVETPAAQLVYQKQTITRTVVDELGDDIERQLGLPRPDTIWKPRPMGVIVVLLAALAAAAIGGFFINRTVNSGSTRGARISTLAVLPVRTFSGSGDEELRLRITDAIITKLGRVSDLVVRPTSSIIRFKDEDPIAAGKALGVDGVLDGRVQQEGERLRVTLQLIRVATGEQIWAEQFDGAPGELLALQDKISERFRRDLSFAPQEPLNHAIPNNEAYEAYLKGRFLWNQRRTESYYKALEYFQKSVEIDPNFALGYCGIADTYHLLQSRNILSTKDAFDKAEPAARRALELEPNLSEANVSMGVVSQTRYARWEEAEGFYRRAIELNPNSAEAHARYGMLLNSWGRFDEAFAQLQSALELDPTSINNAIYLGANYYFSKQFDKAAEQFRHILDFAPGTERAHFFLARIAEIRGDEKAAVEHNLAERAVSGPQAEQVLKEAYAAGGIRAFWSKQVELLKEESKQTHGLENNIASRHVLLGDLQAACEAIKRDVEEIGSMTTYGRVDPIFEPLAALPCFKESLDATAPPR